MATLINTKRTRQQKKSVFTLLEHSIYPTPEEMPYIYGTPEIHKPDVPLRPIVSSIGKITYIVAKTLANSLTPLYGKSPHRDRDFVNMIEHVEFPEADINVSTV